MRRFAVLFLCFAHALSADPAGDEPLKTGHYAGRFTLYFGGTVPLAYQGSVLHDIGNANRDTIPLWSKAQDEWIVYFSRSPDGRPTVQGKNGRHLSLEYALSNHWGISLDVDDRKYVAHGYSESYMPYLFFVSQSKYPTPPAAYPQLADSLNELYVADRVRADILRLVTIGSAVEYHPASRSAFDPYFNLGYHQGREFMTLSRADRVHAGGGIRYFFLDHFFVKGELSLQHYQIRRTNDGNWINRPPADGGLNEGRFELGLGVAVPEVDLTWRHGEEREERKEDPAELKRIVDDLKGEPGVQMVVKNRRITVILLNDAVFPSGSDEMVPAGRRTIQRISRILGRAQNIHFTVEGHTDNQKVRPGAPFASNRHLSEIRATKIRDLMAASGIPAGRLHIQGFGDERPRRANDSEAGRAANRRIEITADENIDRYPELIRLLPEEK